MKNWKDYFQKIDKTKWLLAGLFGLLLLVIAVPAEGLQEKKQEEAAHRALLSGRSDPDSVAGYEELMEERLAQMLSKIEGSGQVQVMLTLKNDRKSFFGSEAVTSEDVEGVLILAEGGEDSYVKQKLQKAVLALFPLSANKIEILKLKT